MTRHARTAYRRHRKAGIATFVLVFAVGLVVASYPAAAEPPPLVAGIPVNLGGQANDCTALDPDSAGAHDFRVTNPSQSGQFVPYTDPGGATFEVKVTAGNTKLEFRLVGSGYYVNDLVIKGGAKSMHYDYDGASLIVTADSNLTGPPKGNTTYAISHVTFCYSEALAKIEGHVWQDKNESRDPAGRPIRGHDRRPDWTVTATAPGVTRTTTTTATGDYVLRICRSGKTYTVCEQAPSGTWTQSVPTSPVCSGPNESSGYQIALTGDVAGKDFGNVNTVLLDCDGATEATVGNATINLAYCDKPEPREYVFETYTEAASRSSTSIPLEWRDRWHRVDGRGAQLGDRQDPGQRAQVRRQRAG